MGVFRGLISRVLVGSPQRVRYTFPCPVCNYLFDNWLETLENITYTFDICPCCGTEFGLDDSDRTWLELREEWIMNGAQWFSDIEGPPKGWDWREQIATIYG